MSKALTALFAATTCLFAGLYITKSTEPAEAENKEVHITADSSKSEKDNSNKNITEEIARLKKQLGEERRVNNRLKSQANRHSENTTADAKEVDTEDVGTAMAALAQFMTPDLKSQIPIGATALINELKTVLELDDYQAKELKALLIEKEESDIDVLAPLFDIMAGNSQKLSLIRDKYDEPLFASIKAVNSS